MNEKIKLDGKWKILKWEIKFTHHHPDENYTDWKTINFIKNNTVNGLLLHNGLGLETLNNKKNN